MSDLKPNEDPVVRTRKRSAVFVDQATKRRLEVEMDDNTICQNGAVGGTDVDAESTRIGNKRTGPAQENENTEKEHNDTGQAEASIPDIVYDETQPKRLNPRRPKNGSVTKGPHVLQESINFLISPDDPEGGGSNRRGRRREAFRYDDISLPPDIEVTEDSSDGNSNDDSNDGVSEGLQLPAARPKAIDVRLSSLISPTGHYERSPELKRKSCSSPVQRMITKTGTPSVSHGSKRKISSHARIESSIDKLQLVLPPKRKISLDSRLGESNKINTDIVVPVTLEQIRKRKVSFDTTALINGNAVIPLNDEIIEPMPQFDEEARESADEVLADEETEQPSFTQPKFCLTIENEPVDEDSTSDGSDIADKDGQTVGYHNRGYVPDDDELQSVSSGTPPPAYGEFEAVNNTTAGPSAESNNTLPYQPMKRLDDAPPATRRTKLTNEDRLQMQKLSTSSMCSLRSSEGGTPKSILKHRKDDAESIASEVSTSMNKFSVRKDSIALFTDHNGDPSVLKKSNKGSSCWHCLSTAQMKQAWQNRDHLVQKYKLHLLVLFLFFMTLAFVVVGLHFHDVHKNELAITKKVFFDVKQRTFFLSDPSEKDTFTGKVGQGIPSWKLPSHCHQNYKSITDRTCLRWKGHGQVDLAHFSQNSTECYNITWNLEKNTLLYDCFDLGRGFWYGPVNSSDGQWPINNMQFSFDISDVNHHDSGTFSSALEYYWLSSTGGAIVLDQELPLILDWNNQQPGKFCFIESDVSTGFYHARQTGTKTRRFQYTVCNSDSIMNTHTLVRQVFIPTLSTLPERKLLESPHWSSVWDSDEYQMNDTVVENLVSVLREHKLNCSTIDIDGKWESSYGDLMFNRLKFANMTETMDAVAAAGCELSLSISPFFNYMSKHFVDGFARGYFVKSVGKDVPALVKSQQGVGAMIDVSNDNAREWIENMLRQISQRYGIKIFRFTYGNTAWVPHGPIFHSENVDPSDVKNMFTNLISSIGQAIVESTADSQHIASLIEIPTHIIDRGNVQCIKNIIPKVLKLGIMGYPFSIIGGLPVDVKFSAESEGIPKRELYIRWMQLAAMMPAMKFTVKPWVYDEEVIAAVRNLTMLHSKMVMPVIYDSNQKVLRGEPIIKPTWMDYGSDRATFTLNDQFLLGSKYVVAPILCEGNLERGMAERNIYIPSGVWKDLTSDTVILGPKLVTGYRVRQFDIPIFEKLLEYHRK